MQRLSHFFSSEKLVLSNKLLFTIGLVFCALLLIDILININVDFLVSFDTSIQGIILFTVICGFYFIGAFTFMKYVTIIGKNVVNRSNFLRRLQQFTFYLQYFLMGIFCFILAQILIFGYYFRDALIVATVAGEIGTAVLLCLYANVFINWFKTFRNKLLIIFSLWFLTFAASLFVIGSGDIYILLTKDSVITAKTIVEYIDYPEGSFFNTYNNIYAYVDLAAFILVLTATAILLSHYRKKIGNIRYCIVVILPAVAYFFITIDNFDLVTLPISESLFYYYWYIIIVGAIGGLFFAIGFWSIAKTIHQDNPLRAFLIITCFGFAFTYICYQTSVQIVPYPPYGIFTLAFFPFATYLIFFGLYSSAASLSNDMKLRQSIRRAALNDANLLSSLGGAHMENEMKRAMSGMKETIKQEEAELAEKTGIETPIEQGDMEDYMKTVMEEVARARKPKST